MSRRFFAAICACLLQGRWNTSLSEAQAASASTRLSLRQVWALDASYEDAQHGIRFRRPSSWKPGTQYGHHPPALSRSGQNAAVKGFVFEEGGFPRERSVGPYTRTNLEGFGFTYAVLPAPSHDACEAKVALIAGQPRSSYIAIAKRRYAVFRAAAAGMSQSISETLYAAGVNETCYVFDTGIAVASPAVLDHIPALTHFQRREIERHLLAIMKTVRIRPGTHG